LNFAEAVAARRSVRAFEDRPVDRALIQRAIALAVQAPAPHHSAPWRFVILESAADKERFSQAMGTRWTEDLARDGLTEEAIAKIVGRSHRMLTSTPVLVVCSADLSRAHPYEDERRLAEWSLFAHATGAALQNLMTSLATDGVASCWLSAPVFCRDVVRDVLGLDEALEPQALVLVGYPSPDYQPRPRPPMDPAPYIIEPATP
jgi:coenzyme F420-0:L-glutamate ligase/coenzyme F420-1:gamma-L-glutamate ligase